MIAKALIFYTIALFVRARAMTGPSMCTRGRLFVAEREAPRIHAFDLDQADLTPRQESITTSGGPGQWLYPSSTGAMVVSVYRGSTDDFWRDGKVSFIHTGKLLMPMKTSTKGSTGTCRSSRMVSR
jgi:hypothetical protein